MVIDAESKIAIQYRTVRGTSERDVLEAYDVAEQACVNQADQSPHAVFVKRGMRLVATSSYASGSTTSVEQSKANENSKSRYFGMRFFSLASNRTDQSKSAENSSKYHFAYSEGSASVDVEVEFANPIEKDVCGEIETDPTGRPKYIGRGRPMG